MSATNNTQNATKTPGPVTAAIVGAGHRSMIYAAYAKEHPDELKIVAVAEPNGETRRLCAEEYDIPPEMQFSTAEELSKVPRLADAVINGTMDRDHVATAVPLLKRGYDMILEKPFACSREELRLLAGTAEQYGSKILICHVLRYSAFYAAIKEVVSGGRIGEIIAMHTSEDVSYHHFATSYVRGKWANKEVSGTTSLLAKCCHDIDIITWIMAPEEPDYVMSSGALRYFVPENAPEDSAQRCTDCRYEDTCPLSAKRIYIDMPHKWDFYVWPNIHDASEKDRYEDLKTNPYGRCAFKCGNNVNDRQSVVIRFKNGAVATHSLTANTAYSKRIIRIVGTKGEIEGVFEDQKFTVSIIDPTAENDHTETVYDLSGDASAFVNHGGGDYGIVRDFVKCVRSEETSQSCTALENSLTGHLAVFAADESNDNGGIPVPVDSR